ncbi:MAG: YadA domain-containing structural protein, partial [Candidatus Yanofskybacteria bacterium GW2011_GWE1_40_10]
MSESTSKNTNKYISLQEASDYSPYSQEYLSLLARKGKIKAKKIGRNWFITRENLESYLKKQSVLISLPKNIFNQQSQDTAVARLASSAPLTPEEEEGQSSGARHAGHSKLFEEFERLNPGIFQSQQPQNVNASLPQQAPISNQPTSPQQRTYTQPVTVQNIQAPTQDSHNIQDEKVMSKLDKLSDSLTNFADKIADVLPKVVDAAKSEPLPQVQTERIIERIIEKSDLTADQKEFIEIQKQSVGYKVKKLNYFSRNSVTNPNKMMAVMLTAIVAIFLAVGGFSFGRIDELALAVKEAFTDSETLGGHFPGTHANEVLLLDKSGNVSIFGHIETEGQLRSRAPEGVAPIVVDSMTKIDNLNADYLDDLSAKDFTLAYVTKNGNITYEDVFLEGNVEIGKSLTIKGAMNMTDSLNVYGQLGVFSNAVFGKDVKLTGGDLIIEKGTIKINNTKLVNNLNAELLNGMRSSDMTLDFVTDNGASTTNTISVGGLNVSGPLAVSQLNVSGSGFFDGSVWSRAGSFQTLGVARSVSLGDKNNSGNSTVEIYSKNFSVDAGGNVGIGGNLVLSGNINSNLIASGSYDLGSSSKRWNTVYGTTGNFLNLTASGSLNFGDTLYVNTASRSVGIGTSQPETDFEIVGVTSASYLLINNTFSVGTGATSSFNVIGLGTPTSPLINSSDDLYVGGNLEVGGAIIGTLTMTSSSVSGNFEVSGITEIADGTAANPSLTFNDDMDTGLFRIGSNIMGITTGGVERLRITDNGASLSGNFDLAGDARLDRDLTVVGNTFLSSASVSDTLEATNLKADSIVSSTGNLNIGAFTLGGNVTGANYNIVGINKFDATSASISTNMEISGYASVGGNVYIGGNETLTGTFSGLSTGSNSFLGSLNVTKSLTAAGINGSFTGNVGIGTNLTVTGQTQLSTASVSGAFEANSLIANNVLQVAGTSVADYSRFGTNVTTHSLSGPSDLLISGTTEFDGDVFVDGTLFAGAISYNSASVSGNFEVGGTLQLADGSAANPSA